MQIASTRSITLLLCLLLGLTGKSLADDFAGSAANKLWTAARQGDLEAVQTLVEQGIEVDSETSYGATALSFAADRGHLDVVEFLLQQGANPNVKDSFYNATPMTWALSRNHPRIVKALVRGGSTDADRALPKAISDKDLDLIRLITASKAASWQALQGSLKKAQTNKFVGAVELLQKTIEERFPSITIPEDELERFTGAYQSEDQQELLRIALSGQALTATLKTGSKVTLYAKSLSMLSDGKTTYQFESDGDGKATLVELIDSARKLKLRRLTVEEEKLLEEKKNDQDDDSAISPAGKFAASSRDSRESDKAISSPNWGQFRGNQARGIADGETPPFEWNVEKNENLAWKTEIPGLGHSCPVVWDGKVYLTSAISENDTSIKTGLYGDVKSVQDESEHEFKVYCFDALTGETLWKKLACKKVPSVKRHLKSTHANSTIATDGKLVVAWFGSEGVYCYDTNGSLVWKKQLGLLDSGWFYDREYQWQFAASPIISGDRLILQCDIQDQSFIAAYELETGEEIWKTKRDEIPSWSTPTVVETPSGPQIVTNATKAARGYDLETGKQLWRIEGNSEIAVPTPFAARGLLFVCSGYRPIQPIYAIRPDATGDLSLEKGKKNSEFVAWSLSKGGPYMPTPLVYGDYLYVCSNSGILTCYKASSGELVYKKRLPMKSSRSFVGAPVAADERLYFTNEEGETLVVQAGPEFKELSHCFTGEPCLTTPAISNGTFFIRGQKHLFALREIASSAEE